MYDKVGLTISNSELFRKKNSLLHGKEQLYWEEAESSTTKSYSDNSLKGVFSTKTITVEFGCSKAD